MDEGCVYTAAVLEFLDDKRAMDTGFAAKNAIGHDVVKLLQDAFNRKHLHVKCVALVNDVGAQMCDVIPL